MHWIAPSEKMRIVWRSTNPYGRVAQRSALEKAARHPGVDEPALFVMA